MQVLSSTMAETHTIPFTRTCPTSSEKTLASLTAAHMKSCGPLLRGTMWSLMRTGTMDGQVSLDPVGVV